MDEPKLMIPTDEMARRVLVASELAGLRADIKSPIGRGESTKSKQNSQNTIPFLRDMDGILP